MSDESSRILPAPVVAIAAWLLPGAGYWLLHQRARALTVGIAIVVLFVMGLLIGGIRVVEVPGWGDSGRELVVSQHDDIQRISEEVPDDYTPIGWVMQVHPLDEIRNKPWYIAQILVGPLNIAASAGSIMASHRTPSGVPVGARSHARTNELGVLYTAVAGMLNLLAIIDAGHRAVKAREERK